ncbi:MAG: D-glycerate dehydrogenase [Thermoanaerobaculia bacterium]
MKRALILGDLPGEGAARLRECCEVEVHDGEGLGEEGLSRLIPGFHGLLTLLIHPVTERVLAAADRLQAVANCAVGVDNIDLAAAKRHEIIVTNTPDVLTADTADLTWALILAVLRGVVSGDRYLRRGDFHGWRPKLLLGRSVGSVVLGVVGPGRIGRAVLARARAFGVRTLYQGPSRLSEATERELVTEWCGLDELLASSDVVSLHLPLNAKTHHLIDAQALQRMKKGSFLINTARGPLVDEAALAEAVAGGHLAGAGLDVYEAEPAVHAGLLELENVVLLPHIGSATVETRTRMADCCFEDLYTVLVEGRVPARALMQPVSKGGRA